MELQLNPLYTQSEEWKHLDRLLICTKNGKRYRLVKERKGKWIYHIDDLFPAESTMECNQCHAEQPLTCDDEFCPHCGADMREEEE